MPSCSPRSAMTTERGSASLGPLQRPSGFRPPDGRCATQRSRADPQLLRYRRRVTRDGTAASIARSDPRRGTRPVAIAVSPRDLVVPSRAGPAAGSRGADPVVRNALSDSRCETSPCATSTKRRRTPRHGPDDVDDVQERTPICSYTGNSAVVYSTAGRATACPVVQLVSA
jgi:hypothetical protein